MNSFQLAWGTFEGVVIISCFAGLILCGIGMARGRTATLATGVAVIVLPLVGLFLAKSGLRIWHGPPVQADLRSSRDPMPFFAADDKSDERVIDVVPSVNLRLGEKRHLIGEFQQMTVKRRNGRLESIEVQSSYRIKAQGVKAVKDILETLGEATPKRIVQIDQAVQQWKGRVSYSFREPGKPTVELRVMWQGRLQFQVHIHW